MRNLILREKANSEKYVNYLRKKGVTVGTNVKIYSPSHTLIDTSSPYLITIGDNVRITHGVVILTHDYSWSVLKLYENNDLKQGAIFGAQSPVNIGNNVFIGMNALITRGVNIGDNVIIGASSVVTKDCEANSVYAGNPAKRIMSITEYREKRESAQFSEAKCLVKTYFQKFGCVPPKEILSEYFMLFCDVDSAKKNTVFQKQMKTSNNYEETLLYMSNNCPMFDDYKDFLEACLNE